MIRDIVKQSVPIGSERPFDRRGALVKVPSSFRSAARKNGRLLLVVFTATKSSRRLFGKQMRGAPAAHCKTSTRFPTSSSSSSFRRNAFARTLSFHAWLAWPYKIIILSRDKARRSCRIDSATLQRALSVENENSSSDNGTEEGETRVFFV